jgi:glycogen debranching enzyme
VFADGREAKPPIAMCEIQGYAYDARIRTARLAREVWNDAAWAAQLENEARELKERFNRDFWLGRRRHFALALDAEKQPVDAPASNVGHLLWSAIVDDAHVAATARILLRNDLFTGWGIRTLSSRNPSYSPLEYHNGAVWPHDTALCAHGLRLVGKRREATRVAASLLDAAANFDERLPELFGGFERDETNQPVPYPDALVPQAWAAASPLLALRTILGLDVVDGKLRADPVLPHGYEPIRLIGVRVRGRRIDVGYRFGR